MQAPFGRSLKPMTAHRLILDRLYEAFNARRFSDYAELLDENVLVIINGTTLRGGAALREVLEAAVRESPGVRVKLERIHAEDSDTIVARARYFDTSERTGTAPGGWSLPIVLCEVYRIAGGRIVEWHDYFEATGAGPDSWPGVAQLAAEHAALRRVATLVARGAEQSEVFDAIVSEAARLLGSETWLLRHEADDTATIVALSGAVDAEDLTGTSISRSEAVLRRVRSGRPARIAGYAALPDADPHLAKRLTGAAVVAAPLLVEGSSWGTLSVVSRIAPLGAGVEERLVQFADLAATTVANTQSRAELQRLADEQGALRRVAELVARDADTGEVFDRVTAEAGRLLGDAPTILFRYIQSGPRAVVVARSLPAESADQETYYTVGASLPVPRGSGRGRVWRTRRAARIDTYAQVADTGVVANGFAGSVSAPITVEGRIWGVLTAGTPGAPLPADTEQRLARFCELVAAAIANAESRAALTASRARIVASADEARRRLARDVHDGAQQRQVHTVIALKQAQAALKDASGPAPALIDESLRQAQAATTQLRDLVHGIMPAALHRGGLRAGVESLRDHVPLTVDAQMQVDRLPESVEVTAYFVIAEALTNVVKHARAEHARVRAAVVDNQLEVEVSDDGHGGADLDAGTGLVGVADRVAAAGGAMSLSSPAGAGTTLSILLPVDPPDPLSDRQGSR